MKLQESKEIVNEAINIAIQKGCFNLQQIQTIIIALEKLNSTQDVEFGEIKPIED